MLKKYMHAELTEVRGEIKGVMEEVKEVKAEIKELKDAQEKDERDAKIKDLERRLQEAEVVRDNQLIADLERKLANALKEAEVAKEN